ncbi:MAG: transposase [Chloroflexi bacterium]|nr:transposase [Chloroflexota bacterium]
MDKKSSNRLPEYDYSQPGGYFITLVTLERQPLLGELIGETMKLSPIGELVRSEWMRTGELRPDITLDEYVIMPNHFHAILFIKELFQVPKPIAAHRSAQLRRQPRSSGAIVAGFKSAASRAARQSLWQRNYYERIIRDEGELNRIKNYIIYNPIMLSESRKEIWKHAK